MFVIRRIQDNDISSSEEENEELSNTIDIHQSIVERSKMYKIKDNISSSEEEDFNNLNTIQIKQENQNPSKEINQFQLKEPSLSNKNAIVPKTLNDLFRSREKIKIPNISRRFSNSFITNEITSIQTKK